MRHTFETMGTVASLELAASASESIAAVQGVFRDYDERFSLYRPDSELSLIACGSLSLRDASPWMLDTYTEALAWRDRTFGTFTPHRPDGLIDLNGVVKAHAIRDAGRILSAASAEGWCLNVGGDVLVAGTATDAPWRVGIVDPADRAAILATIELTGGRLSVATSGTAERGDHIWRGGSLDRPDFCQVTVVADDIVTADVLATAIVAGGHDTLDALTDVWDIDVMTVASNGRLSATPRLRSSKPPHFPHTPPTTKKIDVTPR